MLQSKGCIGRTFGRYNPFLFWACFVDSEERLKVDIIKNDHTGKEIWRYPAEVIENLGSEIRIKAYFNRDDHDAGYVIYKRNDLFIETFYNDRWYNVFAVYDRDTSRLKGWYCNITRPAVWDENALTADDIALDVWVFAGVDREPLVLDQEEFVELGLKPDEMQMALKAVDDILALASAGKLPK